MKRVDALRELADLTASQWGMVTTAQAATRGVTRLQLSRLSESGHLERVSHGIYRDPGAPPERFDALKAAWLSIDPTHTAQERLASGAPDAVLSGPAASYLLGLGDLVPEPYEFTVALRRQSQRSELRYRVRQLPAESITRREGLPVTTREQTIADLVESRTDLSLVANVLRDAARQSALDTPRLVALLSPLAARNGHPKGDGESLLRHLLDISGLGVDDVVRTVTSVPTVGLGVLKVFLDRIAETAPQIDTGVTAQLGRSLTGDFPPEESTALILSVASALTQFQPTLDITRHLTPQGLATTTGQRGFSTSVISTSPEPDWARPGWSSHKAGAPDDEDDT